MSITGTQLVNDAQNRAWRTFIQGIGYDILAAATMTIYTLLSSAETFDWSLMGALVVKSCGAAAASYIMRRYLDPSKFPTPTPPSDLTP